jgi:hypothetical protein
MFKTPEGIWITWVNQQDFHISAPVSSMVTAKSWTNPDAFTEAAKRRKLQKDTRNRIWQVKE